MAKTIFNLIQSDSIGGGMENIFLEYSQIINDHTDQENVNLICIIPQKFCHLEALKKQKIKIEFLNIGGHFDVFAAIKLHFLIKKYSPNLIISHNGRSSATINLCQKIFGNCSYKTLAVCHGGSVKRVLGFNYAIAVAGHIETGLKNNFFKGSVKTIYNGHKIVDFCKSKIVRPLTFGVLSRLSKEKGVDLAIRSFKKFNDKINSDSYLIIGGEGLELEDLQSLTKNLNLTKKVKFIGWVKNQAEFFNQIDIFLQPAAKEPFGITILESFNYKTLVIAANADGPKEIIEDNLSGYLFDPNQEDSLFRAMQKAYEEQPNQQIIINAYQSLEDKFSRQIMAEKLMQFIRVIN